LNEEKALIEHEFDKWKKAVEQGFTDVETILGGQVDELSRHQQALESQSPGTRTGPRIQNGILFNRRKREEEGLEQDAKEAGEDGVKELLMELRMKIRKLEITVKNQPGSGGGGGEGPPAFGNIGLVSLSDLAAWNAEQGSGFLFGLFVDAPALLTFKREDFVSVGDQLAGLKRACDIGLNQIQVKVLASFQNTLPEFFGKGTETEGSSLPAMPKLSDWEADDGIHGAKFKLEQSLPLIQKQLTTNIDTYLGEDRASARELAHRCLSHSMLFVTRLSDYMTRTARSLKLAGYKPDKVWSILSRQILRIFEDMAQARACAVDLTPPKDIRGGEDAVFQDHNAALAMWAVLKTHDVMESYLVHNFEDHPSIAAENVRFLTYNMMGAGGNGTENVGKQVEKVEASSKALKVQLDKLASRLEKLEKSREGRHLVGRGNYPSY
jgi:hypothetical protein